jgi:hypothetical protein
VPSVRFGQAVSGLCHIPRVPLMSDTVETQRSVRTEVNEQ